MLHKDRFEVVWPKKGRGLAGGFVEVFISRLLQS